MPMKPLFKKTANLLVRGCHVGNNNKNPSQIALQGDQTKRGKQIIFQIITVPPLCIEK